MTKKIQTTEAANGDISITGQQDATFMDGLTTLASTDTFLTGTGALFQRLGLIYASFVGGQVYQGAKLTDAMLFKKANATPALQ